MAQINESLEVITQTSNQPVKKILTFDYKAMAVLSVVMVGAIIFLHVFLVSPALEAISGIRINVLHEPLNIQDSIPELEQAGFAPGMALIGDIDAEPMLIWRVLERLFMLLVPPLLVLGVGYFIFRVIREVYRRLGMKNAQDTEHASGLEDIKEFISAPKLKRTWFFGPRGEHKLRKRFRETITRHIKKGVPIKKSDTPFDMAGKIRAEDIGSLVDEYAAVRYGEVSK